MTVPLNIKSEVDSNEYHAVRNLEEAKRSIEYAMKTIGTDIPDITSMMNAQQHISRAIAYASEAKAIRWEHMD